MAKTRKVLTPTQQERILERNRELRDTHEQTFIRDGYACVECGARYGLQEHHILGRRAHPSRILEARNRVTLCGRCYCPMIHTKAGRRKLIALMQTKYGYDYSDLDYSQYLEETP